MFKFIVGEVGTLIALSLWVLAIWFALDYIANGQTIIYGW